VATPAFGYQESYTYNDATHEVFPGTRWCTSALPLVMTAVRRVRPGTLRQRLGWALRSRASDANPLPIFRPGLAVACTSLSSWDMGLAPGRSGLMFQD
jgi:hypothetical protein